MTGEELLQHAAGVVTHRRDEYGDPGEMFRIVAQRWSTTLGIEVAAAQVVLCLLDLKLARLSQRPAHLDSIVDIAGYAACLREVTR